MHNDCLLSRLEIGVATFYPFNGVWDGNLSFTEVFILFPLKHCDETFFVKIPSQEIMNREVD